MQDAIVVMWRKISDYKNDSNFSAWGITIGRYLVMDYYRREGRSVVHFSSEAVQNISDNTGVFDRYDDRMEALQNCIKKLPEESRRILRLRYQQSHNIKGYRNTEFDAATFKTEPASGGLVMTPVKNGCVFSNDCRRNHE